MSTFTMRLKDVIDRSPNGINLDLYPIFSADYRAPLNAKIVAHFWNQEIGVESLSVFRFNLGRKMNEIMPYYNQLYLTEQIKFDPLSTINMSTISDSLSEIVGLSKGDSTTNGDNVAKAISVNSDFPQTTLDDNDTGNYATTSTESNSDATSTSTASENRSDSSNGREESRSTSKGYTGAASSLLQAYRGTLLNIDMMVIADLQELFMGIWDTGDTYTESGFNA